MTIIIGIGTDLVDIRRIARTIERFGERFTHRCFTEAERAKADARVSKADAYAKRYAAKEAGAKALGTGFTQGVFWSDIGVVNRPGGLPILEFTNGAAARLAQLIPAGHTPLIHLTLTDEPPLAHAIVMIQAVPFALAGTLPHR